MNDTRSVHSHDLRSDAAFLAAEIVRGSSSLEVCDTWLGGRIHAAVKHWRGVDPELRYLRQAHTLSLTLSGRSDLTGSLVSGTGMYEGRDSPGCVTYVPPGAERRGWYRNPDLDFLVLVVEPEAVDAEMRVCAPMPQAFTNVQDELLQSVLRALACELRRKDSAVPSMYAEHVAGLAIAHIARRHRHASGIGRLSRPGLLRVVEFIEEHLHEDISLGALAPLAGRGIDVFARQFRSEFGIPPYRYLLERRLQRAAADLTGTRKPIAEIALAVGFSSQSHFTTRFTARFGVSPGIYRRRHRG